MQMSFENKFHSDMEDEHRRWFSDFDRQYLRNWEKVYGENPEAAMAEAATRRFLEDSGATVRPNEELHGKGSRPDFHCTRKNEEFLVEVTCISVSKVTEETGLPHPYQDWAGHYSSLNNVFWNKCRDKAEQCGDAQHPVLVAVCTFHEYASDKCVQPHHVEMLLTGETKPTVPIIDKQNWEAGPPYLQSELFSAAFLRPNTSTGIAAARSSISGMLLCGFGYNDPIVLGILHPKPARPFNPGVLPSVPFCSVKIDEAKGSWETEWIGGDVEQRL